MIRIVNTITIINMIMNMITITIMIKIMFMIRRVITTSLGDKVPVCVAFWFWLRYV